MGLNDRDYSSDRGRGFSPRRFSANTWIIGINVAVFLLQAVSPTLGPSIFGLGHFSTHEVTLAGGLEFWRLVTFQFLHGGIGHVFFNMLGLYYFGPIVEGQLGAKKYTAFYLTCGIFGGVMYLLLNAGGALFAQMGWPMVPGLLFNDTRTPLVGASAGVFGVLMACAYIAPTAPVQLLFPPVAMKMRTLAYAYVGIAAVSLVFGAKNAGGEAAHLGGAVAGFFFIRNSHLLLDFFDVFSDSRTKERARVRREWQSVQKDQKRRDAARRPAADEVEVDRILSKVATRGIQSLSEGEKRTLDKATNDRRAADRR